MITNSNDFLTRLQEIENGIVSNKMINSTTESMVFIDSNARIIDTNKTLNNFVIVTDDNNAETIYFAIDKYFDNVDLSTKNILIKYKNSFGEIYEDEPTETYEESINDSDKLIFGWKITRNATKYPGNLTIQIMIYSYMEDSNIFDYVLNTTLCNINIHKGLN